MTFWLSIIIIGIATVFLKGGFIIFRPAKPFPKIVEKFLEYVPIAAMFAIASIHIIFERTGQELAFSPDKIIAGLITLIDAWYSKNLFITLGAGMGSLWLLHYFLF